MSFNTEKSPQEILDYIIDYSQEMALSSPVDQIVSSVWTLEDSSTDNLTLDQDSIQAPDHVICRVSDGGRLNVIHYLVNRVLTVSGQKHQRTIKVTMRKN